MSANDFSNFVTEMIFSEREEFMRMLEEENEEEFRDEVYEYVSNCDTD